LKITNDTRREDPDVTSFIIRKILPELSEDARRTIERAFPSRLSDRIVPGIGPAGGIVVIVELRRENGIMSPSFSRHDWFSGGGLCKEPVPLAMPPF
jgi:hypothetical protein